MGLQEFKNEVGGRRKTHCFLLQSDAAMGDCSRAAKHRQAQTSTAAAHGNWVPLPPFGRAHKIMEKVFGYLGYQHRQADNSGLPFPFSHPDFQKHFT